MSLLNRKPPSIGRAERTLRDDRFFLLATEDTYAPDQYFKALAFHRVKVIVLPTEGGLSAPIHVLARLRNAFETAKEKKEVQPNDEFWLLLDTDHWVKGRHIPGLLEALRQASQAGFRFAMSNPCFELWLLLHIQEVQTGTVFTGCGDIIALLKQKPGGYNKEQIGTVRFTGSVKDAIRRARALEEQPDDPGGYWPEKAGTRIYLLLESMMGFGENK